MIKQLLYNTNGFQTNVWGTPAWLFLHCITLNYNPSNKYHRNGYKQFFTSLQHVLPCGACRKNYSNIIKNKYKLTDVVLSSREKLSYWLFLVHNQVSQDIFMKTRLEEHKPLYKNNKSDFLKMIKFYSKLRAKCTKDSYGCTIPLNGSRKKSRIIIGPLMRLRKQNKKNSITLLSTKNFYN